jgi:NitT/TauT family transport system permease protein/taurine transport system permease protein
VAKEVIAPAALPMIFTGLRLSLQASWTTLVAAELVGAFLGLGRVLSIAYRDIYPAMIAVAMVVIAIAGALMTQLLARIEQMVIRWR